MAFVPDDAATVDAPAPAAGRFVPDEPAQPAAPRTGAAAIPTEAEAAGKPYVPPAAPLAPKPVYGITDRIKGAVEAGVNTATGVIGALLGGVTGMGQAVAESTGMMAPSQNLNERTNLATGEKTSVGPAKMAPISLEQAMGQHAEGITGALKRTFTGPADLRAEQTPDSELGQQYTEALQPAMETMVAAAPLHGTMGPKGALEPVKQAAGDVRRGTVAPGARDAADATGAQIGKAARKVLPVDPELAKVAQIASEQKYPIDVRPDQVIEGAKFSKLAGQAASDTPLSGSSRESNQVAFTRNLIDMLDPTEAKADRLTPEVFDKAMRRSGEGIGDIMAKTDVPVDSVREGADALRANAEKFATDNDQRIIGNYVDELVSKADENGVINGTALKELNSEIGARARTEAGNDLGRRLNDLQDIIQDAVEKHVEPGDATPLREFRRQYAYGKIVEPLVAKTIDGKVSPAGLMARVTATKQGKQFMARSAGGPIGDLAKVGQLIKEPGSSGTAERSLVYGAIKDTAKTAAGIAGGYPAAVAYNVLGPKLTRAMVGKRAKKAPPTPSEPPAEPTTSPGAGGPRGGGGGGSPGPLGDLTPDWQTTPGAGGGAPRGGHEPGLVPPVGEKGITRFVPDRKAETPSKRAGSEIPAVPGRPGVPDTMLTGRPRESAATERANAAMQEPGAQEAIRQLRLRDEEAARKAIPVGETREIPLGEGVKEPKTPAKIPVGKATEVTPEHIALGEEPIPVGEATHLTPELIEADKKWRTDHKLGEEDAGRARDVARALGHDEAAVERAARQHDNSPRAFDREIARINEEGQVRENESKQAARSGASDAADAGAPVRQAEVQPEPAATVRSAAEQPGAHRTPAAGTGRGGAEPAGRQTQRRVDRTGEPFDVSVQPTELGANRDTKSVMVEARDPKTGERRGVIDFGVRGDGVLTAENVKVAPAFQRRGIAEMMYQAAREAGHDIAPGRVQTDVGQTMVGRLQAKGLINREAEEPRAKAADLVAAEEKGTARGPDPQPDHQPGAVRKEAGQEGLQDGGSPLDKAVEEGQELDQNHVGTAEARGGSVTDTPEFKKWFGGSKVVDEKGDPQVVYHGTSSDFSEFKTSKYENGIYFTPSPRYAGGRARVSALMAGKGNESVMPTFLRMENPAPEGYGVARAKDEGFDGLVRGTGETKEYVVFSPEQIKSAIGNRGTFDPNDPSILNKSTTARKTIGSAGAMDKMLRERFGDKLIQGLKDQGILKYEAEHPERPWSAATFNPGFDHDTKPHATLYYGKLTPEEVPKALMHELGEHFGMVRLLGQERYNVMLNELRALKDTDEVQQSWAHVKKFYTDRDARIKEGGTVFLREVAAHLVESHPDLPFVRRIVNEIRAFFYEHFGTTMGTRVDADLIRGLAAAALRKASKGDLPSMDSPVRVTPLVVSRTTNPSSAPRRLVQ